MLKHKLKYLKVKHLNNFIKCRKLGLTDVICVTCILLLAYFAINSWFKNGSILYFWDATVPLNPQRAFEAYRYVWHDFLNFGHYDITGIHMLPYIAILYFINSIIGFSFSISQKIIYWVVLSFSGIGMYYFSKLILTKSFEKDYYTNLASIISSFFYMFNMYSMLFLWRIFSTNTFLYASFPFIYFLFVQIIGENEAVDKKKITILAIFFLFSSSAHPALYLVLWFVLTITLFFFLILNNNTTKSTMLKNFIFIVLLWIGINMYWILPIIVLPQQVSTTVSDTSGGTLSALIFNSEYSDIFSVLSLKGQQILYETYLGEYDYSWVYLYHKLNINVLNVISFLFPFVLFLPLFFKKKYVTLLGILLIMLAFLVKGIHSPFGDIYLTIFNKYTIFQAFRDPYSKFGFFYTFFYSALFGAGIFTILIYIKGKNARIKKIIILLITLLILGLYTWPSFTGAVIPTMQKIRPSAQIEIPLEYYQVAEYLMYNNVDNQYKIIELPFQNSPLQSSLWSGGYKGYVGFPIIRYMTFLPIISNTAGEIQYDSVYRNFFHVIENEKLSPLGISNLLRASNVKYIIVHEDTNPFFEPSTKSYVEIEKKLESDTGIKLLSQSGSLKLYEVKEPLPLIYVTSQLIIIKNDSNIEPFLANVFNNTSYPKVTTADKIFQLEPIKSDKEGVVKYERMSPVHYKVNIKNTTQQFYLIFNNFFDRGWKTYTIENGKEIQIPKENHFIANGFANGWYINRTGDLELDIYYEPQKYYEIGIAISILTFIICIVFLMWSRQKESKGENKIYRIRG